MRDNGRERFVVGWRWWAGIWLSMALLTGSAAVRVILGEADWAWPAAVLAHVVGLVWMLSKIEWYERKSDVDQATISALQSQVRRERVTDPGIRVIDGEVLGEVIHR